MSNRILSYMGRLADDEIETILLSTKKGEIGYRIIKLQIMSGRPFAESAEHVVKLFKDEDVANAKLDGLVDFSDNRLLGVAIINNHSSGYQDPSIPVIIFDQTIFNQDIYITHVDLQASEECNYYLELEVIKLDESHAMVATLKDIRNNS